MALDLHTMDEKKFREIFDAYKNRIYGYVLAICHSHHTAEEITQEVFIKIWLSGHLMNNVTNLDHYIFTIARNKTLNFLRDAAFDKKRLHELGTNMTLPGSERTDEKLISAEYNQLLKQAIDQLSPQRRKVYELSRKEGLSLEEIAEQLKLSRSTVKNHLVEALRLIREWLAEHGPSALILFSVFERIF